MHSARLISISVPANLRKTLLFARIGEGDFYICVGVRTLSERNGDQFALIVTEIPYRELLITCEMLYLAYPPLLIFPSCVMTTTISV